MFLELSFIKAKNGTYISAIISVLMVTMNNGSLTMTQGSIPCDFHRVSNIFLN